MSIRQIIGSAQKKDTPGSQASLRSQPIREAQEKFTEEEEIVAQVSSLISNLDLNQQSLIMNQLSEITRSNNPN